MEIQYVYTKPRSKFGHPCVFSDRPAEIHVNIPPDPDLASEFIEQNPIHRGIQCVQEMSEHEANTERLETKATGVNHTEGGWPKDVNAQEVDQVSRFRKKVEKDENYISVIQNLGDALEHCIKQNNALDIYENYFENFGTENQEDPPTAKTVTVFRDPQTVKRTANHLSWFPDANKLAVAYCTTEFTRAGDPGIALESYVWDMGNSSFPDFTLRPHSALVCLEYNPKDCHVLAGGCYSGQVAFWDSRKGAHSVEASIVENSHQEPAWKVIWIQSKTGTEIFSSSTDGQVLWWDIRKLSEPFETFYLDVTRRNNLSSAEGTYTLEYEATMPTKFMAGTEKGTIISCNRKGKTPAEKIAGVFTGGHIGPIYALQRNPFYPKNFLTVGDWTARIWSEDIRESDIIWTSFHRHSLTDGCWSPIRPGVFFTSKMDGTLDVWDLVFKQRDPTLRIQVCDDPLLSLRIQDQGRLIACGSKSGTVNLLDLSEGFWMVHKTERAMVNGIFERNVIREKITEQRMRELKLKFKNSENFSPKTQDTPIHEAFKSDEEDIVEKAEKEFFAFIEDDRKKKKAKETERQLLERQMGVSQITEETDATTSNAQ